MLFLGQPTLRKHLKTLNLIGFVLFFRTYCLLIYEVLSIKIFLRKHRRQLILTKTNYCDVCVTTDVCQLASNGLNAWCTNEIGNNCGLRVECKIDTRRQTSPLPWYHWMTITPKWLSKIDQATELVKTTTLPKRKSILSKNLLKLHTNQASVKKAFSELVYSLPLHTVHKAKLKQTQRNALLLNTISTVFVFYKTTGGATRGGGASVSLSPNYLENLTQTCNQAKNQHAFFGLH